MVDEFLTITSERRSDDDYADAVAMMLMSSIILLSLIFLLVQVYRQRLFLLRLMRLFSLITNHSRTIRTILMMIMRIIKRRIMKRICITRIKLLRYRYFLFDWRRERRTDSLLEEQLPQDKLQTLILELDLLGPEIIKNEKY
jgi:hypothetical protein